MSGFIIKRLALALLVVVCVTIMCFGILELAEGDPTMILLPDSASESEREALREEMGLNRPFWERYSAYIADVLQGDLGVSYSHKSSVAGLIFSRLPYTLLLSFTGMLVSLIIAIPLGVLSGVKRGSVMDVFSMGFAMLGQSMAPAWLGIMLIYIFTVVWGVLPAFGSEGVAAIIMPSITLGAPLAALLMRLTRSGMISVMEEDYIVAARAKGANERKVVFRYAFRNTLISLVTVLAYQFSVNLGGAIITEEIFAWPGVGRLFANAIFNRDYPLVQGIILVFSTMLVFVNLLTDITYTFIDPRIRHK